MNELVLKKKKRPSNTSCLKETGKSRKCLARVAAYRVSSSFWPFATDVRFRRFLVFQFFSPKRTEQIYVVLSSLVTRASFLFSRLFVALLAFSLFGPARSTTNTFGPYNEQSDLHKLFRSDTLMVYGLFLISARPLQGCLSRWPAMFSLVSE